ncbi:hypothetical protein BLA60_04370 [Actinophytocola xinjiangensis]|uniref:MbtH-like domain-containing protein n=1 Tax=Actinophytocola xinjiangensis TaxID=485602 RepID=A0A7Z0WSX3_9PSEU|nr:MbtH family NRPS accessory protein [Actinophytocola xinjiangensis]OLF14368.1 hypothetical protein BLA60_04370 [Actinophytocola xinjiangensis]
MNVLDDPDGHFLALRNDDGQFSLWPAVVDVPAGWSTVWAGGRQECLDYVAREWTDLIPASRGSSPGELAEAPRS